MLIEPDEKPHGCGSFSETGFSRETARLRVRSAGRDEAAGPPRLPDDPPVHGDHPTLETVGKEYRAALTQLETRYRIALTTPGDAPLDPDEALTDIIRWVQKRAGQSVDQQKRASALVKRLKRIRDEVGDL